MTVNNSVRTFLAGVTILWALWMASVSASAQEESNVLVIPIEEAQAKLGITDAIPKLVDGKDFLAAEGFDAEIDGVIEQLGTEARGTMRLLTFNRNSLEFRKALEAVSNKPGAIRIFETGFHYHRLLRKRLQVALILDYMTEGDERVKTSLAGLIFENRLAAFLEAIEVGAKRALLLEENDPRNDLNWLFIPGFAFVFAHGRSVLTYHRHMQWQRRFFESLGRVDVGFATGKNRTGAGPSGTILEALEDVADARQPRPRPLNLPPEALAHANPEAIRLNAEKGPNQGLVDKVESAIREHNRAHGNMPRPRFDAFVMHRMANRRLAEFADHAWPLVSILEKSDDRQVQQLVEGFRETTARIPKNIHSVSQQAQVIVRSYELEGFLRRASAYLHDHAERIHEPLSEVRVRTELLPALEKEGKAIRHLVSGTNAPWGRLAHASGIFFEGAAALCLVVQLIDGRDDYEDWQATRGLGSEEFAMIAADFECRDDLTLADLEQELQNVQRTNQAVGKAIKEKLGRDLPIVPGRFDVAEILVRIY